MKAAVPDPDKLSAEDGSKDAGYAAWKQARVEKGLAQCADRAAIIPIEQIWRDQKLER